MFLGAAHPAGGLCGLNFENQGTKLISLMMASECNASLQIESKPQLGLGRCGPE